MNYHDRNSFIDERNQLGSQIPTFAINHKRDLGHGSGSCPVVRVDVALPGLCPPSRIGSFQNGWWFKLIPKMWKQEPSSQQKTRNPLSPQPKKKLPRTKPWFSTCWKSVFVGAFQIPGEGMVWKPLNQCLTTDFVGKPNKNTPFSAPCAGHPGANITGAAWDRDDRFLANRKYGNASKKGHSRILEEVSQTSKRTTDLQENEHLWLWQF